MGHARFLFVCALLICAELAPGSLEDVTNINMSDSHCDSDSDSAQTTDSSPSALREQRPGSGWGSFGFGSVAYLAGMMKSGMNATRASRRRRRITFSTSVDLEHRPAVGTLARTKSLLLAALRVWELKNGIRDSSY